MLNVIDFLPHNISPKENVTLFVQSAIDAASAKHTALFFPSGTYYCGTLYLKDYSHLVLDDGAVIYGVTDEDAYGTDTHYIPYFNESYMDRCFIFARDARNITIEGGTIDGQCAHYTHFDQIRPMLIRMVNCSNIRLKNCLLRDPAAWTCAFSSCSNIRISGIEISSPKSMNGDGTDFDCCDHVIISDSIFDTGDDSICLQASLPGKTCHDVTVTNCIFRSKWAIARIGTSSCGNIHNVVFSNCTATDAACSGFKIQSSEGGVISDMSFDNMVFCDVIRPVMITVSTHRFSVDAPDPLPSTSAVRRLSFSNFICRYSAERGFIDDTGFILYGSPEGEISDISFNNIDYTLNGGGKKPVSAPPEWNGVRPEFMHFSGTLPSYAFYARHAKNVFVRNMRVRLLSPDERPAAAHDLSTNIKIDIT